MRMSNGSYHISVYHPRKKKIRVVFDCSSRFLVKSLNDELLQGPELTTKEPTNKPVSWCSNKTPTTHDIATMFYQVRVLFGAASSPSCANYALRKSASVGEKMYGKEATNTLRRNFYIDNLLKSTIETEETIELITNIRSMCKEGGFNLTKFISNSREVIESLPESKRSKELRDYQDVLPKDHALGILWNISEDTLGLRTKSFRDGLTILVRK